MSKYSCALLMFEHHPIITTYYLLEVCCDVSVSTSLTCLYFVFIIINCCALYWTPCVKVSFNGLWALVNWKKSANQDVATQCTPLSTKGVLLLRAILFSSDDKLCPLMTLPFHGWCRWFKKQACAHHVSATLLLLTHILSAFNALEHAAILKWLLDPP